MKAFIQIVDYRKECFFKEGGHILQLLKTAADSAVSIARAWVEPGVRTRRYRLKGITERYCILEGEGVVEVGDLPPQAVGPGTVGVIPPDTDQRIRNTGTPRPMT